MKLIEISFNILAIYTLLLFSLVPVITQAQTNTYESYEPFSSIEVGEEIFTLGTSSRIYEASNVTSRYSISRLALDGHITFEEVPNYFDTMGVSKISLIANDLILFGFYGRGSEYGVIAIRYDCLLHEFELLDTIKIPSAIYGFSSIQIHSFSDRTLLHISIQQETPPYFQRNSLVEYIDGQFRTGFQKDGSIFPYSVSNSNAVFSLANDGVYSWNINSLDTTSFYNHYQPFNTGFFVHSGSSFTANDEVYIVAGNTNPIFFQGPSYTLSYCRNIETGVLQWIDTVMINDFRRLDLSINYSGSTIVNDQYYLAGTYFNSSDTGICISKVDIETGIPQRQYISLDRKARIYSLMPMGDDKLFLTGVFTEDVSSMWVYDDIEYFYLILDRNTMQQVDQVNKEKACLYPTVTNDFVYVTLESIPTGKELLTIYDSKGALVKQEAICHNGAQVNIQDLSAAMYFYTLQRGSTLLDSGKFIVR